MSRKFDVRADAKPHTMKRSATSQDPHPDSQKPSKKFKYLNKDKYTKFPIRTRAHANPLSDEASIYPESPQSVDWKSYYPKLSTLPQFQSGKLPKASILDVGCAYAGLLTTLSPLHPDKIMLGMEIRPRVVEYSQYRIDEMREKSDEERAAKGDENTSSTTMENVGPGHNIWVIRCNVMKNLVNYIEKAQLEKIFFCYPDPHWKKKNHRRRIISETLLSEYAYTLKSGGLIYTVSDVKELGDWMRGHLEKHPSFEALTAEEVAKDEYAQYIADASEDAQRTEKQKREKHLCIFRRK